MMGTLYTYDTFGWFLGEAKAEDNPQRCTSVSPPECLPPMRPNWTGSEWSLLDYEAWEQEQQRPQPAKVPDAVSMRQARLALLKAGMLSNVNAALQAMPGEDGEAARIEWEFSQSVDRHWPLVVALTASLGWSEAQVDALFAAAAGM